MFWAAVKVFYSKTKVFCPITKVFCCRVKVFWHKDEVFCSRQHCPAQNKSVLIRNKSVLAQIKSVLPRGKSVLSRRKSVMRQIRCVLLQTRFVFGRKPAGAGIPETHETPVINAGQARLSSLTTFIFRVKPGRLMMAGNIGGLRVIKGNRDDAIDGNRMTAGVFLPLRRVTGARKTSGPDIIPKGTTRGTREIGLAQMML